MQALAEFILRSRSQAMLVAVGCAVLAMLMPPMVWAAAAVVALVTLVQGWREGLGVILVAAAGAGLITWLPGGTPLPGAALVISAGIPVWLIAGVLGMTRSLGAALQAAAVVAATAMAGMYVLMPDAAAQWREVIGRLLRPAYERQELPMDQFDTLVNWVAERVYGIFAASLLFSSVIGLLLGRWWQSLVQQPGAFGEEFRELRLDRRVAVLAGLVLVGALAAQPAWLDGLAMLAVVLYLFVGLAVVHGLVKLREMNVGWLVGMYALTVLAVPHMPLLLASMGWLDSWADFRRQLSG